MSSTTFGALPFSNAFIHVSTRTGEHYAGNLEKIEPKNGKLELINVKIGTLVDGKVQYKDSEGTSRIFIEGKNIERLSIENLSNSEIMFNSEKKIENQSIGTYHTLSDDENERKKHSHQSSIIKQYDEALIKESSKFNLDSRTELRNDSNKENDIKPAYNKDSDFYDNLQGDAGSAAGAMMFNKFKDLSTFGSAISLFRRAKKKNSFNNRTARRYKIK